MRKEKLPAEAEKQGYHDYTSAALHSKVRTHYGYYEVKAKPMNSAGSSSFWFQVEDTPGWLTEIDVFEIGGKAKGFEHKYNMTLHVFKTPQEKKHWSVGGVWVAPGGWPTITMSTAWTGTRTRSSSTSMGSWFAPSRTPIGTSRST